MSGERGAGAGLVRSLFAMLWNEGCGCDPLGVRCGPCLTGDNSEFLFLMSREGGRINGWILD